MGDIVRNTSYRRVAIFAAMTLALSTKHSPAHAQEVPLRFPPLNAGASIPGSLADPEQPGPLWITNEQVDAFGRRAAEKFCANYSAPDVCTLKSIERRHVPGLLPASAYSILDVTIEVTNPNVSPETHVSNFDILLLKACPANSVLVDDAGNFLANRDLRTSNTAVACVTPDDFPKGDSLGQPEESGANQCGVGNAPTVGNPINPLTMSKLETAVDFDGGASPTLSFTRFYHSGAFSLSDGVGQVGRYVAPAHLGARWRHTWDRTLSRQPYFDHTRSDYAEALHLIHEDGRETRFVLQGDSWLPVDGSRGTLTADPAGGWLHGLGDGTIERFDAAGRLLSRTDANGNATLLEYEDVGGGDDVLTRVTDPQGRALTLQYGADGQVESVTTPDGGKIRYSYSPGEGASDLTGVTFPDGRTVGYLYDESLTGGTPNHKLTGIIGGRGERFASFRYDTLNRAIWSAHGDVGEQTWLDVKGSEVTVNRTGKLNAEKWTPAYVDGHIRLSDRAESFGLAKVNRAFDYLEGDLVGTKTDYAGVLTHYRYDMGRRLEVERTEAAGTPASRTIKTTWHATLDKPTRIDTGPAWSEFEYDERGNLVERRDGGVADATNISGEAWPDRRVTRYTYDDQGRLLAIDGPAEGPGDTTRLAYRPTDSDDCGLNGACSWRKGDLHTMTSPLGHVYTVVARDGAGRVTVSTDPNGVRTEYTYNGSGQLTVATVRANRDGRPSSRDTVTTYSYDENGLLRAFTDADGYSTTNTYNNARRLIEQVDSKGNIHRQPRNVDGRVQKDTYVRSGGQVDVDLTYNYDDHGNRTDVLSATGSLHYTFDANDRLLERRETAVTAESYLRDERGRVRRIKHGGPELASETEVVHDSIDQVSAIIDPNGLTTAYLRNGLGDLLWQKSPDTGESSAAHDASGNRVEQTRGDGDTVKRKYDDASRLTEVTYTSGEKDVLSYDTAPAACGEAEQFAMGRLSKVEQAGNQTEFCYDFAGRVTRKIQTTRGVRLEVAYEYTPAGRLEKLTYPDGRAVRYMRDVVGHISGVELESSTGGTQSVLSGGEYDAIGHVIGWTAGTRQVRRTYNKAGAIVSITDGRTDGLTADFGYMGMLTPYSITSHGKSATAISNTAGRITSSMLDGHTDTAANRDESYGYDKLGNRVAWDTWSESGSTERAYTYAAGTHHLITSAGSLREYDAQGNTTRIDEREFVYDLSGRMVQAKVNGIAEMNYAYNIFGQQVARYIAGDTRVSLHDEAGHWIGDYDASGRPIQQAAWLDDIPVALIDGDAIRDIQSDHLGSPRVVIDRATDKAIWNWSITGDVFGNDKPDEDPDHDGTPYVLDMRFPGQRFDATTKLFQNGWRDYDPSSGRYVQSDPIGLAGGISTFAYAGSNPVALTDPLGLAVHAKFYRSMGVLQVFDDANPGRVYDVDARSGGTFGRDGVFSERSNEKIPLGTYQILGHTSEGWFRLDPLDSYPLNDVHEQTGRDAFRLHPGTNSVGCITVDSKGLSSSFYSETVSPMIMNSGSIKTTDYARKSLSFGIGAYNIRYGEPFKEPIDYFGTMEVLP